MDQKGEGQREGLETIQRPIEEAAKKVAHTTKSYRLKENKKTPTDITVREGAAARSARPIESKVLMKQAWKARAEHAVNCSLMPGKSIPKRKPLTELYVNGGVTEDTGAWEKELHGHCAEVYADPEEDNRRTGNIIMK